MSAPKTTLRGGLAAKIETTYNTYSAPAVGTDAIALTDPPEVEIGHMHDGSRNGQGHIQHGQNRRTSKTGPFATVRAGAELQLPGAAYDAAFTTIASLHTPLRLCGLQGVFSGGVGTEKHTYSPSSSASAVVGGSLLVHTRGQKYELAGTLGQFSISGDVGHVPKWDFELMGRLLAIPPDEEPSGYLYNGAQNKMPVVASALALTLGAWTPLRVKSFELAFNRNLTPRAFNNTTGEHGGFVPGKREFTLSVVVEAGPSGTGVYPHSTAALFHPRGLENSQETLALALAIGSTQYSRWKLNAGWAQLTDVRDESEGNAAMWGLDFALTPQSYGNEDELTLVLD